MDAGRNQTRLQSNRFQLRRVFRAAFIFRIHFRCTLIWSRNGFTSVNKQQLGQITGVIR
ncbi:hypothetical protein D3C81_1022900 [compost metagenome]